MEPIISLLHPTVRPTEWKKTADQWYKNCDQPDRVEYVLCVERADFPNTVGQIPFKYNKAVYNEYAASTVGGSNFAAHRSTGKVMVVLADDFYSAPHWDTDILKLLEGKLDQEAVIWPHTGISGFDESFISLPILTRKYYMRKGNYIFWPEYTSYYADVEFSRVATLDGVEVIDARKTLMLRHIRGGIDNAFPFHSDPNYKKHALTGEFCGTLFTKREREGFPR